MDAARRCPRCDGLLPATELAAADGLPCPHCQSADHPGATPLVGAWWLNSESPTQPAESPAPASPAPAASEAQPPAPAPQVWWAPESSPTPKPPAEPVQPGNNVKPSWWVQDAAPEAKP